MKKICLSCNIKKDLSCFCKGNDKNNLSYYCRDCCKKYSQTYDKLSENKARAKELRELPEAKLRRKIRLESSEYKKAAKLRQQSSKGIYTIITMSAKKRHINFDLNRKDFIEWHKEQLKLCIYCKRTENEVIKDNNHALRLTIERLDNNLGYHLDNIALCCYRCNRIKGNDISYSTMLKIGGILKNE